MKITIRLIVIVIVVVVALARSSSSGQEAASSSYRHLFCVPRVSAHENCHCTLEMVLKLFKALTAPVLSLCLSF